MDAHDEDRADQTSQVEKAQTGETAPSPPSPALIPTHWGPGENTDRGTVEMLDRAIRNRWPIPRKLRKQIPAILGRIVLHGEERSRVQAARVLAYMDGLNLAQEKRDTGEDNVKAVVHISGEQVKSFANDLLAKRLQLGQGQPSPVDSAPTERQAE